MTAKALFRRTTLSGLTVLSFSLATVSGASAECYWFNVDTIVKQCSAAGTKGRIFEPADGALAIGCGPAECQNSRAGGCAEYGVGPNSAVPKKWRTDFDGNMAWALPGGTQSNISASTGRPGPGSPFDACVEILKAAAKKLGY